MLMHSGILILELNVEEEKMVSFNKNTFKNDGVIGCGHVLPYKRLQEIGFKWT